MRLRIALAAAGLTLLVAAPAAAALREDDPTSKPGEGRRLVCLDEKKPVYLTPDEENTPGKAAKPGPCPGQTPPTTGTEQVEVCIQGTTTKVPKGSTNPNGYYYHEGPCDPKATTTTTKPGTPTTTTPGTATTVPPVRANPRFTG